MSAGGYDGPRMASDYSRQQKQPPIRQPLPNRHPPAPLPPSRSPYDRRYPPEVAMREPMSNAHRPNSYRPDYNAEPEPWNRNNNAWRPPQSSMESHNSWPERKYVPPSPTNSGMGRAVQHDSASRNFEPSASWMNSRNDRPIRSDNSSPAADMYARRGKGSIDRSPERSIRVERPPPYSGGDRYVPPYNPPRRESFTSSRSAYDSYRPPPPDHSWSGPPRRDPISPASSHNRRDSGSYTGRSLSRHDSPRSSQGAPGRPSPAPLSANSSVQAASVQSRPASESWNFVTRVKHSLPARPMSRSSIASTQASERKTSARDPTPPSLSASTPSSVPAPSPQPQSGPVQKPTQPLPALTTPALTRAPPPSAPSIPTSSSAPIPAAKPPAQNGVERTAPEQDVMDVDSKGISEASSIADSLTGKLPSSVGPIPSVASENVPEEPSRLEKTQEAPSQEAMEHRALAEQQAVVPPSRPTSPLIIPKVPAPQEPMLEDEQPAEMVHPESPYPDVPPHDVMGSERAPVVDIPPPTHSPSPEVHSPDIADQILPLPALNTGVNVPKPEDIPQISELKTAQDALRMVVMTRLLYDRQSRIQRVNPVLMANLSIAVPMEVQPYASPEALLESMSTGEALEKKMASFVRTRPKLESYLRQRHGMVEQKITRLRKEYKVLQNRWEVHCNKLNQQQKTLASEHEMQHGGRTTRRTTAITDAVRSDFEMEQIIASLGVDDATDPNCLSARNIAKIPDMISVVHGQVDYVFDDTAHRVENPGEYYAPKTGIHDWTDEEKRIFLEKFAAHPKQFGIIADYIENKTAAQCVDYYYLHKHQFIDFRKVVSQFAGNKRRRRGMGKKRGNGLLADIAIHDMEVRGAAGSPSVSGRGTRGRKPHLVAELRKPSSRRVAVQFEDTPTSTPTPEPEVARGRRRRTVPSTPLASTPVVATPTPEPGTPSVQRDDDIDDLDTRPTKRPRRSRKIKSAAIVDDTSPAPEGRTPLPGRPRKDKGPAVWSEYDKKMFPKLLEKYGDDFARISTYLPPKTPVQCSNYFANHKYELKFDVIIAKAAQRSSSPGSKSRTEQTPDAAKAKVPLPGKRAAQSLSEAGPSTSASKQTSRQKATASSSSSTPVMNSLSGKRPSGYPFPHTAGSAEFGEEGYPYPNSSAPNSKGTTYPPMAGYPPRPTTPVNSSNDSPNIIHSPTGMSPPRPAPPPIPTMTQPYAHPPAHHLQFAAHEQAVAAAAAAAAAHSHPHPHPQAQHPQAQHPQVHPQTQAHSQAHPHQHPQVAHAHAHHHGFYTSLPVANAGWPPVQAPRYFDPSMYAAAVSGALRAAPPTPTPAPASTGTTTATAAVGTAAAGASVASPPVVPAASPAPARPSGNPYPTFVVAPHPGHPHPAVGAYPPAGTPVAVAGHTPQAVNGAVSPNSAAAAARPVQYYPGWTTMQ